MASPTMPHTRAPDGSPELDLLRRVVIRAPCPACGGLYGVTLRQILLAQQLVHEGCPARHEPECPPVTYARLADEDALRQLDDAWWRLLATIRAAGFEVRL